MSFMFQTNFLWNSNRTRICNVNLYSNNFQIIAAPRLFPEREVSFFAIGEINTPVNGFGFIKIIIPIMNLYRNPTLRTISFCGTKFKGEKRSWKIKITRQGEFHSIVWENIFELALGQSSYNLGTLLLYIK